VKKKSWGTMAVLGSNRFPCSVCLVTVMDVWNLNSMMINNNCNYTKQYDCPIRGDGSGWVCGDQRVCLVCILSTFIGIFLFR
jgi:hypothetical protein